MKSTAQLSILGGLTTISAALFLLTSQPSLEAATSTESWYAADPPKALSAILAAQSFTPGESAKIGTANATLVLKAKKSSFKTERGVPDKFALKIKKSDRTKTKYLSADAVYQKASKLESKKKSRSDATLTKTYSGKALGRTSKKFSITTKLKQGTKVDFKVTTKKTR